MFVCMSQECGSFLKRDMGIGMNSAVEVKQRCKGMGKKTMFIKMKSLCVGWESDESAMTPWG